MEEIKEKVKKMKKMQILENFCVDEKVPYGPLKVYYKHLFFKKLSIKELIFD